MRLFKTSNSNSSKPNSSRARQGLTLVLVALIFALAGALATSLFTVHKLAAEDAPHLHLGDPLPENLFVELGRVINPSVVNISSSYMPKRQRFQQNPLPYNDPFFQMFQDMLPQPFVQAQPTVSLGTGFIIRPDGLILTNNHVVQGATIIKVQLAETDKTLYTAKLIGRDQRSDLALIKIHVGHPLPAVVLGQSSKLQVGDWVAAFGNPLGLGHTVTKGIISAIGRHIEDLNRFPFLQTDATINPGNSGGPLVNTRGEVIGVNSAIAADAPGGAIGFAIPIDAAKPIIAALEQGKTIRHAFLGVNIYPQQLSPGEAQQLGLNSTQGALIVGVLPGSPAQKAGFKNYDFVTQFDGKDVTDGSTLQQYIEDSNIGQTYPVQIIRNGRKQTLRVTLEDNPTQSHHAEGALREARGQHAPYNLGFTVANFSSALANKYGLPSMSKRYPIVVAITPGSPASRGQLSAGDMIVDVNRTHVSSAADVIRLLKKGRINTLRILRGGYPMMIFLSPG